MKILILVTIITWSFGGGYQHRPSHEIVASPQAAAIKIYETRRYNITVEPDQKEYHLYQIDLEKKTITEVSIPELSFKQPVTPSDPGS